MERLKRNQADEAWDAFIAAYRRQVFAAIRHYAQDYDDVMDIFAFVCEGLRRDNLARLRKYTDDTVHRARFSTWLVAVVRNLTVDWFRARDGRHRLPAIAATLPPLRAAIFDMIFLQRQSHVECYEQLRTAAWPALEYSAYLVELRATYTAVQTGRAGAIWRDLGAYPPPEGEEDARAIDDRLSIARVLAALETLTQEERVAIQLYVLEEVDADSVARVLGWPSAKTVYNRVYRALAAIRAELEEAGLRRSDL